jgi:hypothetical protein
MSNAFSYNDLFIKAQLYVERAHDEEREGDLYPFWLSLSLEFIIRSTLAKIHPALLADTPNSNDFKSLLYSFGFEVTNQPKSIQITTAINRLGEIINDFTQKEQKQAALIINERNTELHSGLKGFQEFPVKIWISDYYRINNILLNHQGLTLINLFGEQEAKAASIMIQEDDAKVKKIVIDRIDAYKKVYSDLSEDDIAKRLEISEKELRKFLTHTIKPNCPCCGNEALLTGEQVSVSSTKIIDGELKEEVRYLPAKLACFACGLKIDSYQQLKVINLGDIFTKYEYPDPVEYLGIEAENYVDIDELVERRMSEYYDSGYNDE